MGLAVADLDADGVRQDEPRKARSGFHRDLCGDPGTEGYTDQCDIAQIELIEQIEIEIREIVDRTHALGQFGTAETRMRRGDNARPFGKLVDRRGGRLNAVFGMQKKQRRS